MSQRSGEAKAQPEAPAQGATPLQPVSSAQAPSAPRVDEPPALPPGFVVDDESVEGLLRRVAKLERRIRVQFIALVVLAAAGVAVSFDDILLEDVIVQQKLMESRELTLLDKEGNARMFLRMYSKVPVLQILDTNGKPRISLGLRFDDTPFLDLSDSTGRTRATLEMTEKDAPALRMFDAHGNPTFNIN